MIYTKTPKFVFIHIAKAGGSSITKSLAHHLGCSRDPYRPAHFKFLHADRLPVPHREFFVFSVTRNPFDRVVSYYHYLQQIKQGSGRLPAKTTFDGWVMRGQFRALAPMSNQLCKGPKLCKTIDYIGKLENIENDWQIICHNLGIDAELMHDKATKRKPDYRDYYNDKTKRLVAKYYKQDLKTFDYAF